MADEDFPFGNPADWSDASDGEADAGVAPAPCDSCGRSGSNSGAAVDLNATAVGIWLREFSALSTGEIMARENRFLREQIVPLAQRIWKQQMKAKEAKQAARYAATLERERVDTSCFLPVPQREEDWTPLPALSSKEIAKKFDAANQIESAADTVAVIEGEHASNEASDETTSSDTALITADSASGFMSAKEKYKPSAKSNVVKPAKAHLTASSPAFSADSTSLSKASPSVDSSKMNRHQLQDLSRTVRQMRLLNAHRCYVCKAPLLDGDCGPRTNEVLEKDRVPRHGIFTNHCAHCGQLNSLKRNTIIDLKGRVAVVTGARIKIGYQISLKLLRCGCQVFATTRFPSNALLRYQQEHDYESFRERLHLLYADLCNPNEVQALVQRIKSACSHVDILINNAAQTVRRPLAYYENLNRIEKQSQQALLAIMEGKQENNPALLRAIEQQQPQASITLALPTAATAPASSTASTTYPSPSPSPSVEIETSENVEEINIPAASPSASVSSSRGVSDQPQPVSAMPAEGVIIAGNSTVSMRLSGADDASRATRVQTVALSNGAGGSLELPSRLFTPFSVIPSQDLLPAAKKAELFPPNACDRTNDHEPLDLRAENSWNARAEDVDPRELAEVLSTNAMAPFVLSTALKPHMLASPNKAKYIILVSSMEGKLNRSKTNMHAHTNMGKAALNAFTRTVAADYAGDCIYLNSVDTGWNSEERPVNDPKRDPNFETPLDCTDGAARVLDPIFVGEQQGKFTFGQFLKDYAPSDW